MKFRVLAVGARAPDWINTGFDEYARRFPPECPLTLDAIPAPRHLAKNKGQKDRFLAEEGAKMLKRISRDDWIVALDERGKTVTSEQFADKLTRWRDSARDVVFLIGGSDGLAPVVREQAHETMSLSALTLPHYLARVYLAEALYRAWSISVGHPYHRA